MNITMKEPANIHNDSTFRMQHSQQRLVCFFTLKSETFRDPLSAEGVKLDFEKQRPARPLLLYFNWHYQKHKVTD